MRHSLFHHTGRALLVLGLATFTFAGVGAAGAAAAGPVDMGTAKTYAVLGGQSVTNSGPSVLNGDLGVWPGTAISGFGAAPSDGKVNGATHAGDAEAKSAQDATTTAYDDAAGRTTTKTITSDLGNQVLVGGVYTSGGDLELTGTLTLDGEGKADSVFVFQAGAALTTATDSEIKLINGANACNVYWKVGSSATLGVRTEFVGTILALQSISANTEATVQGRLLARNGSVTLLSNTINTPVCAAGNNPTTSTSTTSTTSMTSTTSTMPIDTTTRDTSTAGPGGTLDPTAGTGTAAGIPATSTGGDTSRATRRPAGGTATTNTRSGTPPLAATGSDAVTATAGVLLILMGMGLSWFGREGLAHSRSTGSSTTCRQDEGTGNQ